MDDFRQQMTGLIPSLRAFARTLAPDAATADDLVQETLMRALAARDQFVAGSGLKSWLFTILRNVRRMEVRRPCHGAPSLDAMALEGGAPAAARVEAAQDAAVEIGDVNRALDLLPEHHRTVLILVHAFGFSYEECAQVLGCEVGTVKSRLNRARAAFLEVFGGAGGRPLPDRASGDHIRAQMRALPGIQRELGLRGPARAAAAAVAAAA